LWDCKLDAGGQITTLLVTCWVPIINDDDALELGMNERFDRIDTNFQSLEKRMASMESKVN